MRAFNITNLNNKLDSKEKLTPITSKIYRNNLQFFHRPIPLFEIKFFYSRKEFDKFLGVKTPNWVVGFAIKGDIIIFAPSVFEKVSDHPKSDFVPVLTHEMAHIFLRKINGFNYPVWLAEGIPGYVAEQYKIRPMKKEKIQSFKEIHDRKGWNKTTNYPQAYSFTKHIIDEFGKKRIFKLVAILDKKQSFKVFSKKFEQAVGVTFKQTEKDWLKTIN